MLERRGMLLKVAVSGLVLGAAAGCDEKDKEVGAVEDLMREHGVIRRAILVYRATAARLRAGESPDTAALQRTTKLVREFGLEVIDARGSITDQQRLVRSVIMQHLNLTDQLEITDDELV